MKRFIGLVVLVVAATLLVYGLIKHAAADIGRQIEDADGGKFGRAGMSFRDYMLRRERMIGTLRGMPYNGHGDPRARAIRQLEIQAAQQRKQRIDAARSGGPSPDAVSTWVPVGPDPIPDGQTNFNNGNADPTLPRNPVSGRVLAIDIDPTDPNTAYVGTAQGGLYRTTDGGAHWTPLMDGALSLAVGAITIDPVDPTTLFVGTGEGNFCLDCFFGVGFYIIKNANTNSPTLLGPYNSATNTANGFLAHSRSITKILVVPGDDNTIFVATGSGFSGLSGDLGPSPTPRGLFRCSNVMSGTPSCTKLNVNGPNGGINTAVRDIVFEPGNANNLWVGVDDSIGGGTNGVYLSTNALDPTPGNITFTRKLQTLEFTNVMLAIQKTGSTVTLYAATEDDGGFDPTGTGQTGTVRRTTDNGTTWVQLDSANGFCDSQCFYDMPIAVDPTNANYVYIGGNGDYSAVETPFKKSNNAADPNPANVVFTKRSIGLHPDAHAIAIAPSNTAVVYTGNDGGIFRSSDATTEGADPGPHWTSINTTGLFATQFMSLATHPTDPNFLIGGTQDNGTPFLQANGAWKLGDFGDGGYSLIDRNATDTGASVTAYHTYFNAQLAQIGFVRADGGSDINPNGWDTIPYGCFTIGGVPTSTNGISCSDNTLFYAPMALGPNAADSAGSNTVYFGSDHLYRSPDKGVTMTSVSQVFEVNTSTTPPTTTPVSAIGISPQDDNVRIVGISSGRVFATTTGTSPMIEITPPVATRRFIARAVIDPQSSSTAYVTLDGYGVPAGQHIWKTTNLTTANLATSAVTWTAAGNGIPDVPVNAFAIDPTNSNTLYAGTDIGVYRSTDGGANWALFSDGLPRVAVFDIGFQGSNHTPRIATHGRGIWELSTPTASQSATISGRITTDDGRPVAGALVILTGASNLRTITDAAGAYIFRNLDAGGFYAVTPQLANYTFAPASRSISLVGSRAEAVFIAQPNAQQAVSPLDTPEYFIRQQYLDFLGREPDEGGLRYWSDRISSCGSDAACIHDRKIDVSAAFFMSEEFQQTGSFVYRLYKAGLGRQLSYAEFNADRRQVPAGADLEARRTAFAISFVERQDFAQKYANATGAVNFVNALVETIKEASGVDLSSLREELINAYNSGSDMSSARALALRRAIEADEFKQSEYNPSFVLIEYFGYLKREPDAGGYQFWLDVLNNRVPGNYRSMVCAFITSTEYQKRFSSVVTHSNSECRE